MTSDDSTPPPQRIDQPHRRRSFADAGVATLAAVLDAGAYLTTSALVHDEPSTAQRFRVVTPPTPQVFSHSTTGAAEATITATSTSSPATTVATAGGAGSGRGRPMHP